MAAMSPASSPMRDAYSRVKESVEMMEKTYSNRGRTDLDNRAAQLAEKVAAEALHELPQTPAIADLENYFRDPSQSANSIRGIKLRIEAAFAKELGLPPPQPKEYAELVHGFLAQDLFREADDVLRFMPDGEEKRALTKELKDRFSNIDRSILARWNESAQNAPNIWKEQLRTIVKLATPSQLSTLGRKISEGRSLFGGLYNAWNQLLKEGAASAATSRETQLIRDAYNQIMRYMGSGVRGAEADAKRKSIVSTLRSLPQTHAIIDLANSFESDDLIYMSRIQDVFAKELHLPVLFLEKQAKAFLGEAKEKKELAASAATSRGAQPLRDVYELIMRYIGRPSASERDRIAKALRSLPQTPAIADLAASFEFSTITPSRLRVRAVFAEELNLPKPSPEAYAERVGYHLRNGNVKEADLILRIMPDGEEKRKLVKELKSFVLDIREQTLVEWGNMSKAAREENMRAAIEIGGGQSAIGMLTRVFSSITRSHTEVRASWERIVAEYAKTTAAVKKKQ